MEEAGGQRLLVMEYVPGDTLDERIARGPLPVDEALDVGRQIAAAIEAAHEGGIIHRDLKPGNVKLTADGTVKVLDFGLAKGGAASSTDIAMSPTLTYSPTAIGVILGTAGYMSPEQARGKPVDRRADIWAFACVLIECLTGKKVFEGDTVSDTIARIIEREPDWSALPATTPPRIRELLRRCLEKDIRKRQRDIGDVRIEIEEAFVAALVRVARRTSGGGGRVGAARERRTPTGNRRGLARTLARQWVMGAWSLIGGDSRQAPREPLSLSVSVPPSIRALDFRFSHHSGALLVQGFSKRPDGTEEPRPRVFARRLGTFEFTPIPGTEGAEWYARSPDGLWLAVVTPVTDGAERRVVKLPIDGSSPPVTLADWRDDWSDLHWLADGNLLIQSAQGVKFFRLPTSGGGPGPEQALVLEGKGAGGPSFNAELPDGLGLLMTVESWGPRGYQQDIWNLDPGTGKARLFIENGGGPVYLASTGHVLFARQSALMAVAIDRKTGLSRGEQVALFDGLRSNAWSHGRFSVSSDGHLAFEPGGKVGTDRRIVMVNAAKDVELFVADARPFESHFSVSPDGRQVAVVMPDSRGTYAVWTAASDWPGVRRTIAFPNADANSAFWSPDQKWLAFSRFGRDKDDGVYVQRADGSEPPKAVLKVESVEQFLNMRGWTADSTGLLVDRFVDGRGDILVVPVSPAGEGGTPRPLRATPASEVDPRMSPDGRFLAFESDESGRFEMYVAPVANGALTGQPLVVSSGGANRARWSRDSRRLYMTDPQARVVSVTIDTTSGLRASPPVVMWDLRALRIDVPTWDLMPDGRLIGIQRGVGEDDVTSYNVVLNWLEGIRARLPK